MKSVRKLKKYGTAVAGSALLIGATLTGASASNHDLGDYPQPFVGEDGEVQASIVVGEDAATADVVGAIDIAGSLGQQAFASESVDSGVSVDGEETETALRQDVGNGGLMVDKSDYSVLMRENVEDSNGDDHFVTESVGLDEDGSGVRTKVNGSEVLTVVPEASLDYKVSYAPGFETGEEVSLLGESYELVTVSGSETDLGTTMEVNPSIGGDFDHGSYTVNVEGGNSDNGDVLVNVMEDGDQVDSGQLSEGETLDVNDEFSVTAETVFYSSDEERWVIRLESVLSELQLEEGEAFPLDEDYRVQTVNSKDGDTLQGLELTNSLKTVDDPEDEDETEHLREGETFSGPLDYFQVGFEGLTQEAMDSIEVKDEYEVTYEDTEGFEHTLDIDKVKASATSLYGSNPFLDNGDGEGELRFYSSGDNTWENSTDAMVLDNDNDGVYSSQEDVLVDVDGSANSDEYNGDSQEVSTSDSLSSFDGSESLYATTVSGWSDSEAIFYDKAGNGVFDEEGIVQGTSGASTDFSDVLNPQISIGFNGNGPQNLVLDNSGSISGGSLSTVGLESDSSISSNPSDVVSVGGQLYVYGSSSGSDQSTTAKLIGPNALGGDSLAGGTLTKQTVSSETLLGVDTAVDAGHDGDSDGVVSLTFGTAPASGDISSGDVLALSSDETASDDDIWVIANEDSDGSKESIEVFTQEGLADGDMDNLNVTRVTTTGDTSSTVEVDDQYLNDGTSIESSIQAAIDANSGTIGSGTITFEGTDTYKIESDETSDTATSSVTVETGTNYDISADLNLDENGRDYASDQDLVIEDAGGNLVDGDGSYSAVDGSSGVTLKFHDDSGDDDYQLGEDIVDDVGGSGTYTTVVDSIQAGSGSPSNGDTLEKGLESVKFGINASGTVYNSGTDLVAVDVNDDGVFDSGDTLVAGTAPGGMLEASESEKTIYTDVSGHPVEVEWDPSAGSDGEVTLSYETFDTTLAPGETYSRDTGYGFTLDAEFTDLNSDGYADLSISNGDTTLESQFGAELRYGSSGNVLVQEHGSGSVITGYDGSDEIDSVSFGGTPSAITEEDEETYTSFGSYVEVGSDMSEVSVEVPENQRKALHTVGGEASSGSGDVSRPTGWPETGTLDSDAPEGHKILVGGPAINELTAELADEGSTRAQENYSEGTGYIELIDEAFDGDSALVVAGHSADDTRNAAEFLANYGDHRESMEGTELEIDTASGEVQ